MTDESITIRREDHGALDRAGLAAALVATIAWGMTGPFVHLMTTASAGMITTGRLVVSTAVLLFVRALARGREPGAATPALAVAAMATYYVFATEAFTRAPVVEVTLLVGSAPLIAVIIERTRGRAVGVRRLFGVAIALSGLAAFVLPGTRHSFASAVGDGLAVAAAAVSAVYVTQLRAATRSGRPADTVGIATWASFIGAIAAACLALARGTFIVGTISGHDWWIVALLGAFSTALPTVAFGMASRRLPAPVTTSLSLLTPFFAALFAGLLLGEWPAPIRLPGGLLTLVGIAIVLFARTRPRDEY